MTLEQLTHLRVAVANAPNDAEARSDLQHFIVDAVYDESWLTLGNLGQCLLDAVESERPTKFVEEVCLPK